MSQTVVLGQGNQKTTQNKTKQAGTFHSYLAKMIVFKRVLFCPIQDFRCLTGRCLTCCPFCYACPRLWQSKGNGGLSAARLWLVNQATHRDNGDLQVSDGGTSPLRNKIFFLDTFEDFWNLVTPLVRGLHSSSSSSLSLILLAILFSLVSLATPSATFLVLTVGQSCWIVIH